MKTKLFSFPGNIRPSRLAADMKLRPNGKDFYKGRKVVGFLKAFHVIAISSDFLSLCPCYLRRVYPATIKR